MRIPDETKWDFYQQRDAAVKAVAEQLRVERAKQAPSAKRIAELEDEMLRVGYCGD